MKNGVTSKGKKQAAQSKKAPVIKPKNLVKALIKELSLFKELNASEKFLSFLKKDAYIKEFENVEFIKELELRTTEIIKKNSAQFFPKKELRLGELKTYYLNSITKLNLLFYLAHATQDTDHPRLKSLYASKLYEFWYEFSSDYFNLHELINSLGVRNDLLEKVFSQYSQFFEFLDKNQKLKYSDVKVKPASWTYNLCFIELLQYHQYMTKEKIVDALGCYQRLHQHYSFVVEKRGQSQSTTDSEKSILSQIVSETEKISITQTNIDKFVEDIKNALLINTDHIAAFQILQPKVVALSDLATLERVVDNFLAKIQDYASQEENKIQTDYPGASGNELIKLNITQIDKPVTLLLHFLYFNIINNRACKEGILNTVISFYRNACANTFSHISQLYLDPSSTPEDIYKLHDDVELYYQLLLKIPSTELEEKVKNLMAQIDDARTQPVSFNVRFCEIVRAIKSEYIVYNEDMPGLLELKKKQLEALTDDVIRFNSQKHNLLNKEIIYDCFSATVFLFMSYKDCSSEMKQELMEASKELCFQWMEFLNHEKGNPIANKFLIGFLKECFNTVDMQSVLKDPTPEITYVPLHEIVKQIALIIPGIIKCSDEIIKQLIQSNVPATVSSSSSSHVSSLLHEEIKSLSTEIANKIASEQSHGNFLDPCDDLTKTHNLFLQGNQISSLNEQVLFVKEAMRICLVWQQYFLMHVRTQEHFPLFYETFSANYDAFKRAHNILNRRQKIKEAIAPSNVIDESSLKVKQPYLKKTRKEKESTSSFPAINQKKKGKKKLESYQKVVADFTTEPVQIPKDSRVFVAPLAFEGDEGPWVQVEKKSRKKTRAPVKVSVKSIPRTSTRAIELKIQAPIRPIMPAQPVARLSQQMAALDIQDKVPLFSLDKYSINWLFDLESEIAESLSKMRAAGITAYIRGGYVRDRILRIKPNDCDILAFGTIEQMLKAFEGNVSWDKRKKHSLFKLNSKIKIDVFLVDPKTINTEQYGDIAGNPGPMLATFCDMAQNALFLDEKGAYDPCGVKKEFDSNPLRLMGDIDARFTADRILILRLIQAQVTRNLYNQFYHKNLVSFPENYEEKIKLYSQDLSLQPWKALINSLYAFFVKSSINAETAAINLNRLIELGVMSHFFSKEALDISEHIKSFWYHAIYKFHSKSGKKDVYDIAALLLLPHYFNSKAASLADFVEKKSFSEISHLQKAKLVKHLNHIYHYYLEIQRFNEVKIKEMLSNHVRHFFRYIGHAIENNKKIPPAYISQLQGIHLSSHFRLSKNDYLQNLSHLFLYEARLTHHLLRFLISEKLVSTFLSQDNEITQFLESSPESKSIQSFWHLMVKSWPYRNYSVDSTYQALAALLLPKLIIHGAQSNLPLAIKNVIDNFTLCFPEQPFTTHEINALYKNLSAYYTEYCRFRSAISETRDPWISYQKNLTRLFVMEAKKRHPTLSSIIKQDIAFARDKATNEFFKQEIDAVYLQNFYQLKLKSVDAANQSSLSLLAFLLLPKLCQMTSKSKTPLNKVLALIINQLCSTFPPNVMEYKAAIYDNLSRLYFEFIQYKLYANERELEELDSPLRVAPAMTLWGYNAYQSGSQSFAQEADRSSIPIPRATG